MGPANIETGDKSNLTFECVNSLCMVSTDTIYPYLLDNIQIYWQIKQVLARFSANKSDPENIQQFLEDLQPVDNYKSPQGGVSAAGSILVFARPTSAGAPHQLSLN